MSNNRGLSLAKALRSRRRPQSGPWLQHAGHEDILETYYDLAVVSAVQVTLDYQWVQNPGYNRDRGPVSIFAIRVHAEL